MWNKNKYVTSVLIISLFISLGVLLYISLVPRHYTQPIGVIESVRTLSIEDTMDEHQNKDRITTQELSIRLISKNADDDLVSVNNTFSFSQIKDQHYKQGQRVLLKQLSDSKEWVIIDSKRDSSLIALVMFFFFLLLLIARKQGFFIFLAMCLNSLLLFGALVLYQHLASYWLLPLFIGLVPILIISTLFLTNGWSRKTKLAISATLISMLLTGMTGFIVMAFTKHKGLHYEEMALLTRPPTTIFMTSLLIGSIGAVMDVAMTVSSTLDEIIQQDPNVPHSQLSKAIKGIGNDITGPMINILFFSYLSGSIPLIMILLRNNMSFQYTFSISLSLEIARALVGSIGIVLTIPITEWLFTYQLRKDRPHDS